MIIKTRKTSGGFTVVPNTVIKDKTLSYEALGLWVYLISQPDNWEVRIKDLQNREKGKGRNYGRDLVRKIMRELESFGLASLERMRDPETGVMGGTCWVIYDETTERRKTRRSVNPTVGKTTPLIKKEINTNKDNTHIDAREIILTSLSSAPRKEKEVWGMKYQIGAIDLATLYEEFAVWYIAKTAEKEGYNNAITTISQMGEKGIRFMFENSFLRNYNKKKQTA